jgi:hypothetical protein
MNHLSTLYTVGILAVLLLGTLFAFQSAAGTAEVLETIPQQQGTFVVIETHRSLQDWSGSIMDSDMTMTSREGRGDEVIPITCEERSAGLGSYSLTIQKMEEEGTLIVAVVQDGKVLKQAQTSADFGVVSLAGNC